MKISILIILLIFLCILLYISYTKNPTIKPTSEPESKLLPTIKPTSEPVSIPTSISIDILESKGFIKVSLLKSTFIKQFVINSFIENADLDGYFYKVYYGSYDSNGNLVNSKIIYDTEYRYPGETEDTRYQYMFDFDSKIYTDLYFQFIDNQFPQGTKINFYVDNWISSNNNKNVRYIWLSTSPVPK